MCHPLCSGFFYLFSLSKCKKKHTVKFQVWIQSFLKISFSCSLDLNHVFKCLHFNHKWQVSFPPCSLPPRDFFYFNIKYCKPLIQKENSEQNFLVKHLFRIVVWHGTTLLVYFGIAMIEIFSARLGVCEYFRLKADNTQFRNILAHIVTIWHFQ